MWQNYTFDVTKCDKKFDLLVFDGQIVIHKRLKIPPLEKRKKKGFCKFYNCLGHKTYKWVVFKDLVQNTLKDGRLKFTDKQKHRLEEKIDPKVEEALLVEHVDVLMVDITDDKK